MKKLRSAKRICLRCLKEFYSMWIGNRICRSCTPYHKEESRYEDDSQGTIVRAKKNV